MPSDAHRRIVDRMPPRARLTLDALLRGLSEKQVAAQLSLSRHSVHSYVKDIYGKLGVHSRAELLVALLAPPRVMPPFEIRDADGGLSRDDDEPAEASAGER